MGFLDLYARVREARNGVAYTRAETGYATRRSARATLTEYAFRRDLAWPPKLDSLPARCWSRLDKTGKKQHIIVRFGGYGYMPLRDTTK